MTAWDMDKAVEGIARRQHGAFSDRQARAAGATGRIIRRRLATRRWVELAAHVYALPSIPGTWRRQCVAASLVTQGSAISHRSAAVLHGLKGFRPGPIHIVASPTRRSSNSLAILHRSAWPRTTTVDGVRVVTRADTFFQLAGTVDAGLMRLAFEDAVVAHRSLLAHVRERYIELSPLRLAGIQALRMLIEEHGDGPTPTESELERHLLAVLNRVPGMPLRRLQAPLPGWERDGARVDVLIEPWRLIVEADGRRWHTRVGDFDRDRWRDNIVTAQGYDVLRFSYTHLADGADDVVELLSRYADSRNAAA